MNKRQLKYTGSDSECEVATEAPPIRGYEADSDVTLRQEQVKSAQMWASFNGRYTACEQAVHELKPGQYNIHATDSGIVFTHHDIVADRLFVLPDSASEEILAGIEDFWSKEQHFRDLQFLWKRGILLWGPPGSGKTSCVQQISQSIIDHGGISFYVDDPAVGAAGLELFRKIEPTRPILVMLEDLDAIIARCGESSLLALLDGELQIDNVVFIATTNYPENLDSRITNRPSRFDVVTKIGMPSSEARSIYLSNVSTRLAANTDERRRWVEATSDYSIAHLKEVIVSVEVFDVPLEDTIKRLNSMINVRVTSDDDVETKYGLFNN